MVIGIIGKGVVGTAIKQGFEKINHQVKYHDIKQVSDVLYDYYKSIGVKLWFIKFTVGEQ